MKKVANLVLIVGLIIFSGFLRFWQLGKFDFTVLAVTALSPLLFFLAARSLGSSEKVSLVGSFLLAISPWYILGSRRLSGGIWVLAALMVCLIPTASFLKRKGQAFVLGCFVISLLAVGFTSVVKVPPLAAFRVEQERSYMERLRVGIFPRAFTNKFIESMRYYQQLLFENMDLGNYFFAGHPRERLGVDEEQKFYVVLLPLVLYGFFKVAREEQLILGGLAMLAIILPTVLGDQAGSWGLPLVFPVVLSSANGLASLRFGGSVVRKVIIAFLLFILAVETSIFMAGLYR